jgi:hypothetical protein
VETGKCFIVPIQAQRPQTNKPVTDGVKNTRGSTQVKAITIVVMDLNSRAAGIDRWTDRLGAKERRNGVELGMVDKRTFLVGVKSRMGAVNGIEFYIVSRIANLIVIW